MQDKTTGILSVDRMLLDTLATCPKISKLYLQLYSDCCYIASHFTISEVQM